MDHMNQKEACETAKKRGFDVKEITYGMNGYPSRLGDYAVIGFETFEAAEAFADEVGGTVSHFDTKNGWRFWNNNGQAYKPYSSDDYLSDLGDDYSEVNDIYDVKESMKERLAEFINDGDFSNIFSTIRRHIDEYEELIDAINNAEKDEVVITTNGRLYKIVKSTNMGYHQDVTTYAIGVLLSKI